MTTNASVGTVAALWRFPVKSMSGERIGEAEVTKQGLVGDRAYALIDKDTGKVVSAKSVRLFPGVLNCQAAFVEPPRSGQIAPPVRITLPNGTSITSDASDVDRVLSSHFERSVTLSRSAPEDFTIDQYHPDVPDIDPAGYRDTVVEQKLGSALFAEMGAPSPVPVGAFFDLFPVSVLTSATLRELGRLQPQSRFDERRFRMNVIVGTDASGFPENTWIGHTLAIGGAALRIAMPDPRCVMTTLAQDDLAADSGILRALTRHNRLQVGPAGLYPCAGAYAVVETPGTLRTGQPVALA